MISNPQPRPDLQMFWGSYRDLPPDTPLFVYCESKAQGNEVTGRAGKIQQQHVLRSDKEWSRNSQNSAEKAEAQQRVSS